MRIQSILGTSAIAALVATSVMLAAAAPASADQVWNQSIGRASSTAECPTSSASDQAAGWSPWGASWEQWNNNGQGGYVCSRSLTWAKDRIGAGCVQVQLDDGVVTAGYINFGNGYYMPMASPQYSDPSCSGDSSGSNYNMVYATDQETADQRCTSALDGTEAYHQDWLPANIYLCQAC